MELELICPQPTFTIKNVPLYGSVKCSLSSKKDFNSLDSFDYCKSHGMVLQSAGQAAVARKAFFDAAKGDKNVDLDDSNKYQKLGTIALGHNDGSRIIRVFAEIDISDESRELMRKGLEAHVAGDELFLPVTDSLIDKMLKSGRKTSPLENNSLQCSVEEIAGGSDYSRNVHNIALFGSQEFAELNAEYLRSRGKTTGFTYDYTRTQLEGMLKGKEGLVHVRPCSLGGGYYYNIVNVGVNFYDNGRARGFTCVVEKKNSP